MRKYFLLLSLFLLCGAFVFAQGCSDAGFCTIGNLKPADKSVAKQKFTVVLNNGAGDEGVYVFSPGIQYDLQVSNRFSLQAKLTGNYASGNLGSAAGPGDFFLSGILSFKNQSDWKQGVVVGVKLPLNNSTLTANGASLPMQYQSSLGTIDAIVGYSISNKKWQLAAGWQQPLSGSNKNNFLPLSFPNSAALKYPSSSQLKRNADVLLRANYGFNTSPAIRINVGLLGIYHLAEDTYVDKNISNKPITISGSDGLTLNVTAAAWYQFSQKFSLGIIAGAPAVVRKVRPDGLTRSFSIAPEFIFNF